MKRKQMRSAMTPHGQEGEPSRNRRAAKTDRRNAGSRRQATQAPARGEGATPEAYQAKVTRARSEGQARAQEAIDTSDMTMLIGPAGSGKTRLAVAKAVDDLQAGRVDRIVLSRPAVEAGEKLGFLPGGPGEKVDPFMRPLFDALLQCMTPARLKAHIADLSIEIAPIAFMRGRTLTNCFVILDEAQNATRGQLRMVMTRLGEGSKMVITGDPDQSDLLPGDSGLTPIIADIEGKVDGLAVVRLSSDDVVRHRLVKALIPFLGGSGS